MVTSRVTAAKKMAIEREPSDRARTASFSDDSKLRMRRKEKKHVPIASKPKKLPHGQTDGFALSGDEGLIQSCRQISSITNAICCFHVIFGMVFNDFH